MAVARIWVGTRGSPSIARLAVEDELFKQRRGGAIGFQAGEIGVTIIQMNLFALFALHVPDKTVTILSFTQTPKACRKILGTRRARVKAQRIIGNFQAWRAATTDVSGSRTSVLDGNVGDLIKGNLQKEKKNQK